MVERHKNQLVAMGMEPTDIDRLSDFNDGIPKEIVAYLDRREQVRSQRRMIPLPTAALTNLTLSPVASILR